MCCMRADGHRLPALHYCHPMQDMGLAGGSVGWWHCECIAVAKPAVTWIVSVQANTAEVPILSAQWSLDPAANKLLRLPSKNSPILLEQLVQDVCTDAAGNRQEKAQRLVVAICGAGEKCPSAACNEAHGLYPGVAVSNNGVRLHESFTFNHSGAGGGTSVILTMGEVTPWGGGQFSSSGKPGVLPIVATMASQEEFEQSCRRSIVANSKLPCHFILLAAHPVVLAAGNGVSRSLLMSCLLTAVLGGCGLCPPIMNSV
jgi:hypothetical protein